MRAAAIGRTASAADATACVLLGDQAGNAEGGMSPTELPANASEPGNDEAPAAAGDAGCPAADDNCELTMD